MSRPDIADLLDHYGVIGHRRMVPCPLHEDRTPSCSINYEKSLFNCFSCGEGGDSWSLIMKREGLDFEQAQDWAKKELSFKGSGPAPRKGGRRSKRKSSYKPSWRREE